MLWKNFCPEFIKRDLFLMMSALSITSSMRFINKSISDLFLEFCEYRNNFAIKLMHSSSGVQQLLHSFKHFMSRFWIFNKLIIIVKLISFKVDWNLFPFGTSLIESQREWAALTPFPILSNWSSSYFLATATFNVICCCYLNGISAKRNVNIATSTIVQLLTYSICQIKMNWKSTERLSVARERGRKKGRSSDIVAEYRSLYINYTSKWSSAQPTSILSRYPTYTVGRKKQTMLLLPVLEKHSALFFNSAFAFWRFVRFELQAKAKKVAKAF